MAHPSKIKGDGFERLVRDLLLANELPAERIPAGASGDIGDIWTPGAVIQCKNHRELRLSQWLRETEEQQERARKRWHWLTVKRRNVADPEAQYAICSTMQMVEIMQALNGVTYV